MERSDLIAYARRPWGLLAEADAEHWLARKRELGPAEGSRMAGELYALVTLQRPDWPCREERDADLAIHVRVSEALRSVAPSRTP
jgi:hypothetical protein